MHRRLLFLSLLLCPFMLSAQAQSLDPAERWADSVMHRLKLRQQAAQVVVARVPINMTERQQRKFLSNIQDWQVGGVCFFAGTTELQKFLTQQLQDDSRIPLMICLDAETGVGMRLTDVPKLPSQMLLGAMPIEADSLLEKMGMLMGFQCRQLGVHVNFAPVVDVNTNPLNPIIGTRSFGQDHRNVAHKATLLMLGMQRQGVMAVAKHFPGHGDTDADSHVQLPMVRHSRQHIDSVLLYPFRHLFNAGVGGCMVAHLHIPSLDTNRQVPSSLSPWVVDKLMRQQMHYEGLVFTDGLDMKAVSDNYDPGKASCMALLAGNDVLLLPADIEVAIDSLVKRADKDTTFRRVLRQRCRRVLMAKYHQIVAPQPVAQPMCDVNDLTYRLALNGVTLLRSDTACLGRRLDVTAANYKEVMAVLDNMPDTAVVTLCVYGSPYLLNKMQRSVSPTRPTTLVVAYDNLADVRRAVDTLLACRGGFVGRLPVDVTGYPMGSGLDSLAPLPPQPVLQPLQRLHPEIAAAIDSVVQMGLDRHAYPGCQLLVLHHDSVLYEQCYGRMTYDSTSLPVTPHTRYDLASVTKMAATTMAVMRLVQEGKVKLDDKMSKYLRYLRFTNKRSITVREVLSHCAGLQAGDAYWRGVMEDEDLRRAYASDTLPDITEKVLHGIASSKRIREKYKMVYSDLGFILLGDLVKKVSGVRLDRYVDSCFYRPLGLQHTCFNPLLHGVAKDSIAPTEYDTVFRGGVICGTVHDPNAAAMGGVAGHAGLFGNAEDMGRICQLLLHEGVLDGDTLLKPATVQSFNQRYFSQYGNRRALGFDKPLFNPSASGNTAVSVSQRSYGHTGFTGTMIWVDPDKELVFVFLSNRVYPNTHPNLLANLNIRTDIQELIYQAIK